MNRHEFRAAYASIASALGSEFHDASAHDDDRTAREIRSDLPDAQRVRLISTIISDANRMVPDLNNCWEVMAEEANRQIASQDEAREWLIHMVDVWKVELARIQGGLRP